MSEFVADDPEVVIIADVFRRMGWKWATGGVTPFVPSAEQIAETLDSLLDDSQMFLRSHVESCEYCANGDREYCGDRPRSANASTGRLYLSWTDEGYGPELDFGISWTRPPAVFAGVA